jgi:hypothetical protein
MKGGMGWPIWLRHCATGRKVAGSISIHVIGIFYGHKPSVRAGVDLASNANEHQEYFLENEGGRCIRLTISLHSCADCLKIWDPEPPGTLWTYNRPLLALLYLV